MKRSIRLFFSAIPMMVLLMGYSAPKTYAQDVMVSYQTFYDQLSPYGQWVNDPQYGNVFVPMVGPEFRPYFSDGHWVMTEYGNTWVSDEPWGWACYHYGRWTYNPYYGWVWIPGFEWAPAWVSWRYGGNYCGWAPLAPGYAMGQPYYCPDTWWVFVQPNYMYYPHYHEYWRGPEYNQTYIQQTTIIQNVYVDNSTHVQYYYGPRSSDIEKVTHQPVQVYRVNSNNEPGVNTVNNNQVNIYRPSVNRESINVARPANVMSAPQPIGKPQSAVANTGNRSGGQATPPPFRQEAQKFQATHPNTIAPKQNEQNQGNHGQNNGQSQGRPENQPRNEQPQGRPENQPRNDQPQSKPQNQPRNDQPQSRPENQPRNEQPQNRPQNQPQTRPQNQPQQQPHNNPPPRNNPPPKGNSAPKGKQIEKK